MNIIKKILLILSLTSLTRAAFVSTSSFLSIPSRTIRPVYDGRCTRQPPTTRTNPPFRKHFRTTLLNNISPQEIIEAGVSFDTFAPQFLWLPMIVAPRANITKTLMGGQNGMVAIVALALVHFTIVVTAASQEGALDQVKIFTEVFDPSLSQLAGMQKLFQYQNFVAEEWPHVLIWDLFVGRMIWLDGLKRGVNSRLALAFCNGIGPPGFLIYVATCLISGKGLPTMDSTIMDHKEEDSV